jgi:hypothetical protein
LAKALCAILHLLPEAGKPVSLIPLSGKQTNASSRPCRLQHGHFFALSQPKLFPTYSGLFNKKKARIVSAPSDQPVDKTI